MCRTVGLIQQTVINNLRDLLDAIHVIELPLSLYLRECSFCIRLHALPHH